MFLCIGIGFFFALPNLYGDDPALQISGTHGIEIDQAKADEITNLLSSKDLNVSSVELEKGQLLIRFDNTDVQIAAKEGSVQIAGKKLLADGKEIKTEKALNSDIA